MDFREGSQLLQPYRICRVSRIGYAVIAEQIYEMLPGMEHRSYEEQLAAVHKGTPYNDSFSREMNALGNESHELIFDIEPLQKTWARENGVAFSVDHWKNDILLAQIRALRPDVLYIQGLSTNHFLPPPNFKDDFDCVKLVVGFAASKIDAEVLDELDLFLVGWPSLREKYVGHGPPVRLVYHGFDLDILSNVEEQYGARTLIHDFTFAGSSGYGMGLVHIDRYWTLVELLLRTPLEVWLNEEVEAEERKICSDQWQKMRDLVTRWRDKPAVASDFVSQFRQSIEQVMPAPPAPIAELFESSVHDPVFRLQMFNVIRNSRLSLNTHPPEEQEVGNMRMFEAAGIGTCVVTDTGPNLIDLFEEDTEIVTYRSVDECVEKVEYLLRNEDERAEIAAAAQMRVLKDHTIGSRCMEIDSLIREQLSGSKGRPAVPEEMRPSAGSP